MSEANRNARLLEALFLTARHASQVSCEFMRGMAARMAMSFEKYGDLREAYPNKLDALASMQLRIDKYQLTGNTEYLMDAANFCMIEYMRPRHALAHFKAEDSAESPGRVSLAGDNVGQSANTLQRENTRVGGFYKRDGD